MQCVSPALCYLSSSPSAVSSAPVAVAQLAPITYWAIVNMSERRLVIPVLCPGEWFLDWLLDRVFDLVLSLLV